jgi:hypothetical protein
VQALAISFARFEFAARDFDDAPRQGRKTLGRQAVHLPEERHVEDRARNQFDQWFSRRDELALLARIWSSSASISG